MGNFIVLSVKVSGIVVRDVGKATTYIGTGICFTLSNPTPRSAGLLGSGKGTISDIFTIAAYLTGGHCNAIFVLGEVSTVEPPDEAFIVDGKGKEIACYHDFAAVYRNETDVPVVKVGNLNLISDGAPWLSPLGECAGDLLTSCTKVGTGRTPEENLHRPATHAGL